MFKAMNTIINSVADTKTSFINQYFVDQAKAPALAYVEAQREFGKTLTEATEAFASTVKDTVKVNG